MPRLSLSTSEVADRLGTNEQHVRKLARERRIPHYRIGGLLKFDPDEVERFVREAYRAVEKVSA